MVVYSVPAAGRLSPQLACRQPPSNYSELKGGSNTVRHCQRSLSGCVGSVLACGPIRRGFESLFWNLLFSTFLPRDASAERGNARVSRPSVCLSVCLSVCDV